MFKCQVTNEVTKPGDKMNKVVVETRDKVYHKWVLNEDTRKYEQVQCSSGFETVRELSVSDEGLQVWESMGAHERAHFLKTFA